jgi:aryl-alcohol dehydrogenase-like predicted oxidoreductase
MIQLPLNIFDQRMVRSGAIARLAACGIEVHARSAFLQGLLTMDPARAPRAQAALQRFHEARSAVGLSAPAACLAYINQIDGIDAVVVGVKTLAQLRELVESSQADWDEDLASFAIDDPAIVDPRTWS